MGRVMINVGEQNGLREGGFDVFSRTPVTMPAGSNLEIVMVRRIGFPETRRGPMLSYLVVKRTVHAVLLSTEDIRLPSETA